MGHASPLRYPGGKAGLSDFLADAINQSCLGGCDYYEPYAGGAGAALTLLMRRVVSEVHLNDADPRVHAFWRSALEQPKRFADQIRSVPLTINEWRKQREICERHRESDTFDLGFATFYMNRCNRSGVLIGAGPIGGFEQAGSWRMDVRFNREALAGRILRLADLRESIHLHKHNAITFLKTKLPRGPRRKRILVYLDPPYVNNGHRLYMNHYKHDNHKELARYLLSQKSLPWILSYDDCDLIRGLYRNYRKCKKRLLPLRYALQGKRLEKEILVASSHISLPPDYRRGQARSPLQEIN